jgi:hypothetical protein
LAVTNQPIEVLVEIRGSHLKRLPRKRLEAYIKPLAKPTELRFHKFDLLDRVFLFGIFNSSQISRKLLRRWNKINLPSSELVIYLVDEARR